MGWTSSYNWNKASDVKRELLSDYAAEPNFEVLAHRSTCYGRHFWMALKNKKTGRSFVVLFLLGGGFHEGWAYKDVSEDMGPCELDCPIELLDMTDEPTEKYAVAWRARVRAAVAARKGSRTMKYVKGDKVTIYGKVYVVYGISKRSYIVMPDGDAWRTYKCGPSKMRPYVSPEQVEASCAPTENVSV